MEGTRSAASTSEGGAEPKKRSVSNTKKKRKRKRTKAELNEMQRIRSKNLREQMKALYAQLGAMLMLPPKEKVKTVVSSAIQTIEDQRNHIKRLEQQLRDLHASGASPRTSTPVSTRTPSPHNTPPVPQPGPGQSHPPVPGLEMRALEPAKGAAGTSPANTDAFIRQQHALIEALQARCSALTTLNEQLMASNAELESMLAKCTTTHVSPRTTHMSNPMPTLNAICTDPMPPLAVDPSHILQDTDAIPPSALFEQLAISHPLMSASMPAPTDTAAAAATGRTSKRKRTRTRIRRRRRRKSAENEDTGDRVRSRSLKRSKSQETSSSTSHSGPLGARPGISRIGSFSLDLDSAGILTLSSREVSSLSQSIGSSPASSSTSYAYYYEYE